MTEYPVDVLDAFSVYLGTCERVWPFYIDSSGQVTTAMPVLIAQPGGWQVEVVRNGYYANSIHDHAFNFLATYYGTNVLDQVPVHGFVHQWVKSGRSPL